MKQQYGTGEVDAWMLSAVSGILYDGHNVSFYCPSSSLEKLQDTVLLSVPIEFEQTDDRQTEMKN